MPRAYHAPVKAILLQAQNPCSLLLPFADMPKTKGTPKHAKFIKEMDQKYEACRQHGAIVQRYGWEGARSRWIEGPAPDLPVYLVGMPRIMCVFHARSQATRL